MKICFVSGHLDLTHEEFKEHYNEKLVKAVDDGCGFVVGDCIGADSLAQIFFKDKKVINVKVFHMFENPRNYFCNAEKVGGFKSDKERDMSMTNASDFDIAWVRPGREKSGTAKNLRRRK